MDKDIKIIKNGWNWNNVQNSFWNHADSDVKIFSEICKNAGCKTILDIGAGRGRHAILLAEMGFQVLAIDISNSSISTIKCIQKSNVKQCRTLLWDMHRLDELHEQFDAIIANNSIYHTNEIGLEKVLYGIWKIMKVRGLGFATFLSTDDYTYNGHKVQIKKEEDGNELEHIYLTKQDIQDYLYRFSIMSINTKEYKINGNLSIHYSVLFRKL